MDPNNPNVNFTITDPLTGQPVVFTPNTTASSGSSPLARPLPGWTPSPNLYARDQEPIRMSDACLDADRAFVAQRHFVRADQETVDLLFNMVENLINEVDRLRDLPMGWR